MRWTYAVDIHVYPTVQTPVPEQVDGTLCCRSRFWRYRRSRRRHKISMHRNPDGLAWLIGHFGY